jgi:hypothetical protein
MDDTQEYYSAIKEKKILLSENMDEPGRHYKISQSEKDRQYTTSLTAET